MCDYDRHGIELNISTLILSFKLFLCIDCLRRSSINQAINQSINQTILIYRSSQWRREGAGGRDFRTKNQKSSTKRLKIEVAVPPPNAAGKIFLI